jgi:hypothetical protein
MFAAEEYRTYVESGDKAIFESVVTLENSENNHQEYFKRLMLRRIYAAADFAEREAEALLRQWVTERYRRVHQWNLRIILVISGNGSKNIRNTIKM